MKIVRIETELIKTDDNKFLNRKLKKLNRDMNNLEPGIYKVIIEKESDRLTRLKYYYFSMESSLGEFLGMSKAEIHDATKTVVDFMKPDANSSDMVYDSIAGIKDENEMMNRIYKFQSWSAKNFNYKHEPFKEG